MKMREEVIERGISEMHRGRAAFPFPSDRMTNALFSACLLSILITAI